MGSDVAVVEPPGSAVGPTAAAVVAQAAGVRAVEPLQHRFAYVGPDLQDLYGVQASTFAQVAPLQDAFVPGSTIASTMAALQSTPDGVLLSAETLHDYQLHPGDLIRIRLQTGADHAYRPVDFHVVGQVTEWPTAPKDSFIVANADYVAQQTGSDAVGTFLVSTDTPTTTAAALRAKLAGTGATVQDISSAGSTVTSASGLAGTDLSGLSRLELGFGVAAGPRLLRAGSARRHRGAAPRARAPRRARRDRRANGDGSSPARHVLWWSPVVGGAVIGATIAYLLVKVLTGIFDPAPAAATIPWTYLSLVLALVVAVTVVVVPASDGWRPAPARASCATCECRLPTSPRGRRART